MNYKAMKHPLTREQVEELTQIALELEQALLYQQAGENQRKESK